MRRVIVDAQEEAFRLKHNYIGTEHLLLDALGEPEWVGGQALDRFGVGLDQVRDLIVQMIGTGSQPPSGHIPFTPRSKRVMELAAQESVQMGHEEVGTGHLLLGLVLEVDGVAGQVLASLGVELGAARAEVMELRAEGVTEPRPSRVLDEETGPIAIPQITEVDIGYGAAKRWALQSVLYVLAAIAVLLVGPPDSGLQTAGLIFLAPGVVVSLVKAVGRLGRWLRTVASLVFALAALIFVADSLIN